MEQQLTFFLALAVGLVFGGLAVWLMLRADTSSAYGRAKAELAAEFNKLNERLAGKETKIAELIKERDQLKAESDRQRQDVAALQASKAELEGRSEEKLAAVNQAQEKLAETFRALSAEALESNNQAFLHLAGATLERFQDGAKSELESRQKAIDSMVQPISQSLGKVDDTIRELEKSRAAAYAGISEQVKSLLDVQNLLRSETSNLVSALRTPTVRGRWGEMQLRRVVEMAGMVPHCDFEEQPGVTTEDGRLRPDMIVRLPGQRQVVVDAKVALKAYLEALDATDEETRQAKLAEHAAQVRSHLQKLGSKGYWDQLGSTPEFVVAFLPGEAFFSAALEKDPELIEFGIEHKVILSTPTTLIALLKAVSYGWRQEKLAHNAQEISNLGKNLYDRLCTFTHHLESVGANLQRTVEGYNRSVGSLESRVLVGARRFQDLGSGAPDKELPLLVPLDNFPRSLQAVEHAVSGGAESDTWFESPEEEEEILEAEAETGNEAETANLDDGLEEDEEVLEAEAETGNEAETANEAETVSLDDGLEEEETEEVVIEAVEGSNPLWLPGQLNYEAPSPPLAEEQAEETASESVEEVEELAPEVVEEAESPIDEPPDFEDEVTAVEDEIAFDEEPPEETPEELEVPACESEEEIPEEVLETFAAEPAENEVPEERTEDEVPATQEPGPAPADDEEPSEESEGELVEKGDGGRVNYLSFVKAM